MTLHHQSEHDFGVALGVFLCFAKGSYPKENVAHPQFERLGSMLTKKGDADGLQQKHSKEHSFLQSNTAFFLFPPGYQNTVHHSGVIYLVDTF